MKIIYSDNTPVGCLKEFFYQHQVVSLLFSHDSWIESSDECQLVLVEFPARMPCKSTQICPNLVSLLDSKKRNFNVSVSHKENV